MDINEWLIELTGNIDGFMYTYILLILLVVTGVYFTIRTKCVQIRYLKDMFRQVTEKKHVDGEKSISSFQALMVSTASRVGTGNIAGVATAIALGGPGAVFWMWLMAIVGAASAFIESTLAQIWKIRGKEGEFRGGPAYYIEKALGHRWLGILFAVLLILCYAFGFNGLQAYNACSALEYYVPDYNENGLAMIVGLLLVLMTATVIFGGQKRISVITSIVVPVMALAYIAIALWTTISNIAWLPAAFAVLFESAFDFESIFGGFAGSVVMLGIKRGLYSNEAGMGSAPIAAAAAQTRNPVRQALVSSTGTFWDTVVVCAMTGLVLVSTIMKNPAINADQIEDGGILTTLAFGQIPYLGPIILTLGIICFAYSTILGWAYYGERCVEYFAGKKGLIPYRILYVAVAAIAPIVALDVVWALADILNALMAIPNLIAVLLLSNVIASETKKYINDLDAWDDTPVPVIKDK